MKDSLKGCHLTDAVEVHVASKIALYKVISSGFEKCFEQFYEHCQKCVATEGQCLKSVSSKGFLVSLDSRYGSCPRKL
jgi:hypothetical protein